MAQELADKRRQAGARAEKQLAFYLNRAFGQQTDLVVLHNLRLVDPSQANPDGTPGVAQMDHLVIHRHGVFVVESKSVVGEVSVRGDGSGGDEWVRAWGSRKQGMPSPIQQAQRQGAFLRHVLQSNREALRGKLPLGLRTFGKLAAGTDQCGFMNMPMQVIVAISDGGRIDREKGWRPPQEPLPSFVCKADLVASKIQQQLDAHKKHGGFFGGDDTRHGSWEMKPEEVAAVGAFLAKRHQPSDLSELGQDPRVFGDNARTGVGGLEIPEVAREVTKQLAAKVESMPSRNEAICKACSGSSLNALWGRYGYYWQCLDCQTNTTMPVVCHVCGAQGHRGKGVKVSKKQNIYTRSCEHCGTKHVLWRQ